MKQKLTKLLHIFSPAIILIVSSFMLSLIHPISEQAFCWIALISICLVLFQHLVYKKRPQKAPETSVVLILIAAICAIYLIVPLTKEEMIFGAIMYSGLGVIFIYYLITLFAKK